MYQQIDQSINKQNIICDKDSLNLTCEEGRTLVFIIKIYKNIKDLFNKIKDQLSGKVNILFFIGKINLIQKNTLHP